MKRLLFSAAAACCAAALATDADSVDSILEGASGARYLLVGDGPLATALVARAPEAAPDLFVVPLRAADPDVLEAFRASAAAGAPSKRAAAAAELGPVPFLVAWLLDSPETASGAFALADAPAAAALAPGFDAVPSGGAWRPVRAGTAPSEADLAAFDEARDRVGEALAAGPEGGDALGGALRRHFSRLANDLGRRLALAGDAVRARELFGSALAIFPASPSALLNLASLERAAADADPGARARLASLLQGLRPTGGILAVDGGVLLGPSDFFDAGWFWTVSGLPASDTNAVAETFAALPPAASREQLSGLCRISFSLQRGAAEPVVSFMTRVLPDRDSTLSPADRLAAADLLADASGDFLRAAALVERFAAPGAGGVPASETAGGDAPFWVRAAAAAADCRARRGDAAGLDALRAKLEAAAAGDAAALAAVGARATGPAYAELGRWDGAARAFASGGADAAPLAKAAAALASGGDPAAVRAALAPVLAGGRAPWVAHRMALEASIRLVDREGAAAHAAALLKLRPRDAFAHWALGSIAAQKGDRETALRHLQTSVASRASWVALNDLASLLVETGNPAQAESFARMAVEAAGAEIPALRETLGEALKAGGKFEEAAAEFGRALAAAGKSGRPPEPRLRLQLAETLEKTGDRAGAARQVELLDKDKDALTVDERGRLGALRKALAAPAPASK